MKVRLIYIEQNRITEEEKEDAEVTDFTCDWCDSDQKITFNTYLEYIDPWGLGKLGRVKEIHYLCVMCISKIMQKYIKGKMIDIDGDN